MTRSTLRQPATMAATVLCALTLALVPRAPLQAQSRPAQPRTGNVIPGIEVLLTDSLHLIKGKRVGLLTNHSGRDRKGTSTIDLLFKAFSRQFAG